MAVITRAASGQLCRDVLPVLGQILKIHFPVLLLATDEGVVWKGVDLEH